MMDEYPIVIIPLSEADGGGFLGMAPDLAGCMSDGETREEAIQNTSEAIEEWLAECERMGREVPEAGSAFDQAEQDRATLIKMIQDLADITISQDERIAQLSADLDRLQALPAFEARWGRVVLRRGSNKQTALPFRA